MHNRFFSVWLQKTWCQLNMVSAKHSVSYAILTKSAMSWTSLGEAHITPGAKPDLPFISKQLTNMAASGGAQIWAKKAPELQICW